LNLSNKRLTKLEDALRIEELNPQQKPLSQLHSLIEKLGSVLPKLYALDLSSNHFTHVPTALQQLVTLTQLTFAMNRITSICKEITALTNLLSLDLQVRFIFNPLFILRLI
jgi:Leucine-rich repeat (LRR) protein